MSRVIVATFAVVWALLPSLAVAQTIEEVRHQAELRTCASLAEAQRKPCEDGVRAKVNAEWKARIEEQARRRTSN